MQSIFGERKKIFSPINAVELSNVWTGHHRRYSVLQSIEGENGEAEEPRSSAQEPESHEESMRGIWKGDERGL